MNPSLILTFIEVVKKGSLSKASTHMNVSVASVSRHIDELERQLKVQLFIRSTRKLELTDAGDVFFNKVKDLPLVISEAQAAVDDIQGEIAGKLTVVLTPVDFFSIAPHLNDFSALYPKLKLKFIEYTLETLKEINLAQDLNAYDVLILPDRFDLLSQLSSMRVAHKYTHTMQWCASEEYIGKYGEPISLSALREHYVVARKLDFDQDFKGLIESGEAVEFGRDVVNLKLESIITVYGYIMAGHGVGLLPNRIIDSRPKILRRLLPSVEMPLKPCYILRQDILKPTKKVEAFIDLIKSVFVQ